MKIAGRSITVVNQKVVKFSRKNAQGETDDIVMVVSPLPIAFERMYEKTGAMQYPIPPSVPIRDENTGVVLMMEDGSIAVRRDMSDKDFMRKFHNADRRISALKFKIALREDESIEFESVQPSPKSPKSGDEDELKAWQKSWIKYTDALADEIDEAGFTKGEVDHVLATSAELEISTGDEKVQANF